MAHVLWYETRCFYLASTEAKEASTDEGYPPADEREAFIKQLMSDGWEGDPTATNSYGFVNVRRPYQMARHNDGLKKLAADVYVMINTLSNRVDEIEVDDAVNESTKPHPIDIGTSLEYQFPGTEWVLTVKGGVRGS